jgi:GNAT superfamily N-acetyltransferase
MNGSPAGYFELARGDDDEVQIAYFGLTPPFIGRGLGGVLLTQAIREAWHWDATRVWVHTCNLDHPGALANYQARGMRIYRRT